MRPWTPFLLLIMSRFRPSFAQGDAITVVTLPPPTSINPTSTTAQPTAAATVAPAILYPSGNPIINSIDTLVVQYTSPWQTASLTVSCGTTDGDEGTFSFRAEDLPPNGSYDLTQIDQTLNPATYPIYCHLTIADGSNTLNSIDSGDFIMTSTAGSPSRYAQTTTAVVGSATASITSARTTSSTAPDNNDNDNDKNPTASAGSALDTLADTSPTSAASKSDTEADSSNSDGGLSGGAKAGIAFGVIIGVALLALLIFLLLRYRRKLQQTESELQRTQAEAKEAAVRHASEKAYVDGILTAAGKPGTAQGGRVVVADLGNRQSGDWRQFFASKASSAKQAISSVGSRANSRSGSRANSRSGSKRASRIVTSRPGTSGAEDVPGVPSLPSPSLMGETASIKGEGSTVGLVSGDDLQKHSIKRKPLRTPGQS